MTRPTNRKNTDDAPALPIDRRTTRLTNGEFAVLAAVLLVAVALRITLPYNGVFTPGGVRFMGTDPWYHVRATEYAVANFPHALQWDPYARSPDGQFVAMAPLLDWMAAGVSLAIGGGSPSPQLVHAVCAWLPPLLGLATIAALYALARMLFDRTVALFAVAICATLPGPFLTRTLLGYADHHAAEICFSTLAYTAIVLALRRMDARRATEHDAPPPTARPSIAHIVLPSAIAGVMLGCYLLSWFAGSLLVFILFSGLLVAIIGDVIHRRPTAPYLAVILPTFLMALVMVTPMRQRTGFMMQIAALAGGAAALALCIGIATLARRYRISAVNTILAIIVLLVIAVSATRIAAPDLYRGVNQWVGGFMGNQGASTVDEATSILSQDGRFSLRPLYGFFTSTAGFAIAGGFALVFVVLRRNRPDRTVFLIWSLVMMLALLKQRRFSYYAAVNMAVLAAFTGTWIARTLAANLPLFAKPHALQRVIPAAVVVLLTIGPNLWAAVPTARRNTGPTDEWIAALAWLRSNTPPPFDDPNHFTADYRKAGERKTLAHYGVMSWWDHGYWIIELARRVPVANPTQSGATPAARFLLATDELAAVTVMRETNARFVVLEGKLLLWKPKTGSLPYGKFPYIPFWAGEERSRYYDNVLMRATDGRLKPTTIYYPDYFRSMCVRLFMFEGKAVTPENTTWLVKMRDDGGDRPIVDATRRCETYEAALSFLNEHPGGDWRLAGLSPYDSCVPLPALQRFQPVYGSPISNSADKSAPMDRIRVFELLGGEKTE